MSNKNDIQFDVSEVDIALFKKKINESKKEERVEKDEELRESLPAQNAKEHGTLSLVSITGIGLTKQGKLTKTSFFDSLDISQDDYKDIYLTPEEAQYLANTYRHMTTGINAAIPLRCTGDDCPFAHDCPYVEMKKAPVGKPCKVERDMLNYHTRRFIEEFNVDMDSHSEIMLIQELSELIIMETRVTHVLADPENAQLYGIAEKFNKDGDVIKEEVVHWAVDVKERLKNRRMKILESLNATRKSSGSANADSGAGTSETDTLKEILRVIKRVKADEVEAVEVESMEDNND